WLEVEDTYAEGEVGPDGEPRPNVGRSNETFTFIVISENELLARIGEEEEKKRDELRKSYAPLDEKQKELDRLIEAVDGVGAEWRQARTKGEKEKEQIQKGIEDTVSSLSVRAGTLDTETVASAERVAKDVLAVYQKILREMRLNQCRADLTQKVHD